MSRSLTLRFDYEELILWCAVMAMAGAWMAVDHSREANRHATAAARNTRQLLEEQTEDEEDSE